MHSLWFSRKEQLANRKEHSAAKPQTKAELTTDRTDATDKGNPSNPQSAVGAPREKVSNPESEKDSNQIGLCYRLLLL